MKKLNKILVFMLMLVVTIASIVASPVLGIVAAATGAALIGANLTLKKMPTKGEVNKSISIPVGSSTEGTVSVKVLDPNGNEVALGSAVGENYNFTPTMIGDYKVQYTVSPTNTNNRATTKSEVYTIKVEGQKATLSFKENTPFILPEKVGKDSEVVLPYPEINETGDSESLVAGTYSNVSVEVYTPKHVKMTNLETVSIDGETYYVFKPAKDGEETVYGTYAIYYNYVNGQGLKVTNAKKITVSANYKTEKSLTSTWSGSMPTTAVLGKEVELPKPVVVDKNSNNQSVSSYTKVTVNYVNGTDTKSYTVNDYKFTPMDEAKNGSRYTVKYDIYTLEDLNLAEYDGTTLAEYVEGIEASATYSYSIDKVTDTVSPTPFAVNAYAVNQDGTVGEVDNSSIAYTIPNKVRTGVAVSIPAIFATDNYDGYEKLTLTRNIVDEAKKSVNLDTKTTGETVTTNENFDYTTSKVNEIGSITFKKKGTYTLKFLAKDSSGNPNGEISFKINVQDSFTDEVAPYITMPTVASSVKPGEEVSFNAPQVIDYTKDHTLNPTDSSVTDSNVKTNVYYYYGTWDNSLTAEENLAGKSLTELKLDGNDKYSIAVPAETTETNVTIVVKAEDDARYAVGKTENNVAYGYRTVAIYSTNDSEEPVLVGGTSTLEDIKDELNEEYGQNEIVRIPEISFTDNNIGYVTTSLMVLDANGNEINVSGVQYNYDGTKLTMKNGKFVTTVAGRYSVVITATDIGGNSIINSVEFDVEDTKAPSIQIDKLNSSVQVGETYKLPSAVVIDDGKIIENSSAMTVEFVGDDNPQYKFVQATLEFTPLAKGTYSFRYVASDGTNKSYSDVYTITAIDDIKPVIVLDESLGGVPATIDKNVQVDLPTFLRVDDLNGIRSKSLTVTDPDGDEVSPVEGTTNSFIFTVDGAYKVVYKAVDLADNETTLLFTIEVGDVEAPVVTLTDENKISGDFKIGDTFTIDLDGITIKDNVYNNGKEYDIQKAIDDKKLVITLVKPDGTPITLPQADDNYTVQFNEAGTYTLKYEAYDEAGKCDPIEYTFEVKADTSNTAVSEQTWGVILTVATLALLCGVVVYFVKTKDAGADRLDKSKELAKKNKKED